MSRLIDVCVHRSSFRHCRDFDVLSEEIYTRDAIIRSKDSQIDELRSSMHRVQEERDRLADQQRESDEIAKDIRARLVQSTAEVRRVAFCLHVG
jgi:chromosome segregation ATPase